MTIKSGSSIDFPTPEQLMAQRPSGQGDAPQRETHRVLSLIELVPPTHADVMEMAREQARSDHKAEAKRRILSVASDRTQANLQANFSAGLLTPDDATVYLELLKWIKATVQTSRNMPVELSAATAPFFDYIKKNDPTDDGLHGETWLNSLSGSMFVNQRELADENTAIWVKEDAIIFNANFCGAEKLWPKPSVHIIALAQQY